MRQFLRILWLNGLILFIGMLIVEGFFGDWFFPDRLNTLYLLKNVSRDYDVSRLYPTATGKAHYTRDAFGLRGHYSKIGDVSLVTLGGSTTDQRYIDDQQTWQTHLENCLKAKGKPQVIANAGVDGQSSFGHLLAWDRWLSRIEGLHARWVLIYLGSNDYRTAEKLLPEVSGTSLYQEWFHRSAVAFVARTIVGNFMAQKGHVFHQPVAPDYWQWTKEGQLSEEQAQALLASKLIRYEARLETLIKNIKEQNSEPILVAQWDNVVRKGEGLNQPYDFEGTVLKGMDHEKIMRHFHQVTEKVAAHHKVHFWNLAGEGIFADGDFYDMVHNTPSGTEKIGHYLCEKFSAL